MNLLINTYCSKKSLIMAFSHLSMDTESYQLFLSNTENEKQLVNPNISSAGSFEILLDRTIDLSPLLYMKSTNAEVAVSHLSLSNLPLCVSRDEEIKVRVHIPTAIAKANRFYSPHYTETKVNQQYHRLPLNNLITAEPDTLLAFLNRETLIPYIHFVLRSLLQVVLDDNVFDEDETYFLSREDIKLLNRYINISLYTRNILHNFLHKKLGHENYEIGDRIIYSKDCENYTLRKEESMLQKSKALLPTNQRPATRGSHDHVIDLALFHGKVLENIPDTQDSPKQAIETDYENYLTTVGVIKHVIPNDPSSPLKDTTVTSLESLIRANKALIVQAMKLHDILELLVQKIDSRKKNNPVTDHLAMMSINDATGKLKVDFTKATTYLLNNGCSVRIIFPPKLSHVLGSDTSLTIGPIRGEHPLALTPDQDVLTNTIFNGEQTTFFPLRPLPKMYHLLTNIIVAPTCNLWLKDTPFETCNIIHSTPIDDASISNQFVCKQDDSLCYHRLNTRLLTRIQFHIVDDEMKPVSFAPRCHIRIGLNVRPTCTNQ